MRCVYFVKSFFKLVIYEKENLSVDIVDQELNYYVNGILSFVFFFRKNVFFFVVDGYFVYVNEICGIVL